MKVGQTKLILKEVLMYCEEVISGCNWSDGCYSKRGAVNEFQRRDEWER